MVCSRISPIGFVIDRAISKVTIIEIAAAIIEAVKKILAVLVISGIYFLNYFSHKGRQSLFLQ